MADRDRWRHGYDPADSLPGIAHEHNCDACQLFAEAIALEAAQQKRITALETALREQKVNIWNWGEIECLRAIGQGTQAGKVAAESTDRRRKNQIADIDRALAPEPEGE